MASTHCLKCGALIAHDSFDGICPTCMAKMAFYFAPPDADIEIVQDITEAEVHVTSVPAPGATPLKPRRPDISLPSILLALLVLLVILIPILRQLQTSRETQKQLAATLAQIQIERNSSTTRAPANHVEARSLIKSRSLLPASCEISPDGKRIAAISNHLVGIIDVPTGNTLLQELRHNGAVASVHFSPDSRRIVTASADGTARVWNTRDGQPLTPLLTGATSALAVARFTPDATHVVGVTVNSNVFLWNISDPSTPKQSLHSPAPSR